MDIVENAKYHCDRHIVKMPLEAAQMLCTAHWATGGTAPYKKAHLNHPCTIWVRKNTANYLYLCNLGLELCKEYTYRYGKRHGCQDIIEWCLANVPLSLPKTNQITEPPQAMPEVYKSVSVVDAYRKYYKYDKERMLVWKNRDTPKWLL